MKNIFLLNWVFLVHPGRWLESLDVEKASQKQALKLAPVLKFPTNFSLLLWHNFGVFRGLWHYLQSVAHFLDSPFTVMLRVHLLHFTKCDRSRNEFWAVVVWARSGPIVYAQATTTTLAFHPTQWAESLNQPDVGGGISVASKIDWVTNTRTTWTVRKLLKVAV